MSAQESVRLQPQAGERRRAIPVGFAVALGAGLFALTLVLFPDPKAIIPGIAIVLMVGCVWYDLDSFRVPNIFTYSGTLMLLLATLVLHGADFPGAVLGMFAGFGSFFALSIFSRGTVGLGDAKLAGFGGALVGLQFLLPALLIGSLSAAGPVLVLLAFKRITPKQALPYAPALALGFVVVALLSGSTLGL